MRAIILAVALLASTVVHAETAKVEHLIVPAGSCVSSPFGPRIIPNAPQAGTFHNGIDLPAPIGTPVRAIASGKLLRIQYHGPGGIEVLIQHNGFVSLYSHLGEVMISGENIAAGQEVGTIGRTGVTFGPHLFFGILKDGRAIDPAPILGTPRCSENSGPVIRQMTPAEILAMGGKLPPTRTYPMPAATKAVSTPARPRA